MDLLPQIQDALRKASLGDALAVSTETTISEIVAADWPDTVNLVLSLETAFGVSFSISEIAYLSTVGDAIKLIERKRHQSQQR